MGRLASHVAERLSKGEEVHVVNCEFIVVSGKRQSILMDFKKMREIGSTRKGPYYPRMPHRIFKRTVRGMLKYQQPSGRAAYKRLKVHIGIPPELKGETPQVIEDAKPKSNFKYMSLGEISEFLGVKFR